MAGRIRVAHLLIAGGLMLVASPAFAQDGMLFKNLMEGTFGRGEGADIDYRERAPLVVPPNSTLPPPQQSASTRNAAWPKDPDVQRRKEDKNRRYVPADGVKDNPLLSAEEIRRGRSTTASQRTAAPYRENDLYNNVIGPIRIGKEQAARYNEEAEKQLSYGSEPPRRTLTEPPTGYRRPAATAAFGPGVSGPVENTQAVGEREFVTGQKPMMGR
ncbi:hypothetical protein [uncultured Bosea sp.]|uniref:hypothetical protein n=1 Tax=uncultured Bosea sp. TaxID=211457 RepID=UPI00263ABE0E|nr:hypothetical protein [uncultured Bosea sp.]